MISFFKIINGRKRNWIEEIRAFNLIKLIRALKFNKIEDTEYTIELKSN